LSAGAIVIALPILDVDISRRPIDFTNIFSLIHYSTTDVRMETLGEHALALWKTRQTEDFPVRYSLH
jgi:hypothetical protein